MMPRTIEAIYEDGVLKPVIALNIPEHKKITLIIEEKAEEPSEIMSLAAGVYGGFSPEDIEEVEQVALDRSHFSRD